MNQDFRSDAHEAGLNRFATGLDDILILPLVLTALVAERLLRATFSVLVRFLDYAFPIVLQLARFPLFTTRILGDGLAALLAWTVQFLPVSDVRRAAWRTLVSRRWSWLRERISYRAFEEAVHHAFERGMAWVFRACGNLTPGAALLVLAGAVIWLPVSFGIATTMHAVLIAQATSLPPWMQLLHPVATIIAKSKLLVLPVYPAAWPQSKKHPFMQSMLRFCSDCARLKVVRKTRCRYEEVRHALCEAAHELARTSALVSLVRTCKFLWKGLARLAAQIGTVSFATARHLAARLSGLPLVSAIVTRYVAHYEGMNAERENKFSEKVRAFFQRWSVMLSAEYYEANERGRRTGACRGCPDS